MRYDESQKDKIDRYENYSKVKLRNKITVTTKTAFVVNMISTMLMISIFLLNNIMLIIDSFNIQRIDNTYNNNIYRKQITFMERENNNNNNNNDDNNDFINRYHLTMNYQSNYNLKMLSTCKYSRTLTTTFSLLSYNNVYNHNNYNNYHQQYHHHYLYRNHQSNNCYNVNKHKQNNIKNTLTTKAATTIIKMSLIPINKIQINKILTKQVNTDQWLSYWGNNKIERLQRVLESVLIAYGGAWLSWFFSFMAGGIVSAFLGR